MFQIITGVGIPVELGFEAVTIGYVFKCEFFLPENATNFIPPVFDPFDITTRPISGFFVRRKRKVLEEPKPTENPMLAAAAVESEEETGEKVERYEAAADVVEEEMDEQGGNGIADEGKMSEADFWNQEDESAWNTYPLRPRKQHFMDESRWTVYRVFAALLDSKGFVGKACVLRAICESAQVSFDHSNGILGELTHIVLT